uniref:DUF1985 domain-containing protein n=1 Tax=Lactuca sativa TaxID=4236 RepID=A0A9R1W046_LACSA|nr:hypothetical protein LSAT_V11C300106230 [Lactuca sativa]
MGLLFGPQLVHQIPLPLRFFVHVSASVDFFNFSDRTSSNPMTTSLNTSFSGNNDLNQQNLAPMERNFPNIFADGYGSPHDDLDQKSDLTLKGMIGTIFKDYFPRLTESQRVLFEALSFGRLLGMHIPHGDPLLVHLIMLHELRSKQVSKMGRFLFEIHGMQLDFGETEYILICGLRVGPYVDLLHDERGWSNSNLRARLFPDITDAHLRLKDSEDYIMSPNYLPLQDEDVVMLIQLVFMLKGLHGQDVKMSIPTAVYKLADNIDDWNGFAWASYLPFFPLIWILETFLEATQYYIRTPTKLPRMRSWRSKTSLSWVQCRRIINVSVPNNHPIADMANETELMLPFYNRYVNWTLNHEESPPWQCNARRSGLVNLKTISVKNDFLIKDYLE